MKLFPAVVLIVILVSGVSIIMAVDDFSNNMRNIIISVFGIAISIIALHLISNN